MRAYHFSAFSTDPKPLMGPLVVLLAGLLISVGCGLVACAPAPKAPQIPKLAETPQTKPDGVSSAHVGMTLLSELSHIERALKPFNGVAITGTALAIDASTASTANCRTTQTTNLAQWETRWRCGVDPKVSGRKEIIGVERLNYDQKTRTLTYDAKFEIRTFDDREPRAQAHTLVTGRKIRIRFDRGSTAASSRAAISMLSVGTISVADRKTSPGSNYQSRFEGVLLHKDNNWSLGKDSMIHFDGALYGIDGDRKTNWASGTFTFVPQLETGIKLLGLGDSSCTKPIGSWRLSASGAGKKIDTTMETSELGGVTVDGSTVAWPSVHCDEP